MADGRFSRRDYRGRSPPRNNDRYPNDRRQNWSPPRNRRRDDFDRRDNSGNWDRFGRDVDRRKINPGQQWKIEGPLLTESQFNDSPQFRGGMTYEVYKAEHKKHNANLFFDTHRNDPRFKERYNPTSIVERRKRDAAEAQTLAKQFLTIIEDESFALPNYDADAHEDLFPEFVMEVEEPIKVIEIDENNNIKEEKQATTENKPESNEENKEVEAMKVEKVEEIKDEAKDREEEYKKKKKAFQDSLPQLVPISTHERIPKDLELIQKLTAHFDQMRNINSNPLLGKFQLPTSTSEATQDSEATTTTTNAPTEDELAEEQKITEYHKKFTAYSEKQQLDLFIYYLMTVHFHVYYPCVTFPSVDKDKAKPVYRSSEKHHVEQFEHPVFTLAWGDVLDKKIQERLNLDLTIASGEKKCDEFLEIFYNEKIIKDSPERFRCDICSKMFKGPIFVKKHIAAKHPEKIEEIKERAIESQFFLNYLLHCEKAQEYGADKREKTPPKDTKPKIDKDKDLRVRDTSTDLRRRSKSPPRDKRPRSPPRRGPWEGDDRRQVGARGGRGGGFDNWGGRGSGSRGGRGKFPRNEFDHGPELRDKMDPRAKAFVDLDKPQENSFDMDYEKALAAFEEGGDDS